MYLLESFTPEDGALIVNETTMYRAYLLAKNEVEANNLVVGLNQAALFLELEQYRYSFETAGLDLADGIRIKTDRESQSQLSNCFVDLKHGLIPDTDWKGSDWQLVNLEQIEPIAKAVAAHRRGCFSSERQVQTLINEAVSAAELEAIDIPALFGAAYKVAYSQVIDAEQAAE